MIITCIGENKLRLFADMTEFEWKITDELIEYNDALAFMEQRVADIRNGAQPECVWFLEHPPLFTAGTSAKAQDLLKPRFPVHETGRGGQYTYHGPGQRVAYVMLNLKQRYDLPDIKHYVWSLEEWVIRTLADFDIKGYRIDGRVGIWVSDKNGLESKIAAMGVRVRHWVTYHGISINLNPDLSHFDDIIPCGISDAGVTSFQALGKDVTFEQLDAALKANFPFT